MAETPFDHNLRHYPDLIARIAALHGRDALTPPVARLPDPFDDCLGVHVETNAIRVVANHD